MDKSNCGLQRCSEFLLHPTIVQGSLYWITITPNVLGSIIRYHHQPTEGLTTAHVASHLILPKRFMILTIFMESKAKYQVHLVAMMAHKLHTLGALVIDQERQGEVPEGLDHSQGALGRYRTLMFGGKPWF